MHIAINKITLRLPENQNLKGKRRIINSLISKLRHEFNVAVAEVEHQDLWQLATLGIVSISSDSQYLQQLQAKLLTYIESLTGEFQLTNQQQEIIHGF